MIWVSFGWVGKSSICFVDGRMNSNGYREVLKNHPVDIGNSIGGSDWIFQQDNAPVHWSKVNIYLVQIPKNQCSTLAIIII